MIKSVYYLKDAKASGETQLYASCTLPTGRVKVYLPLKVSPTEWDPTKQHYRKSFPNSKEANAMLERLSAYITSKGFDAISKDQSITIDIVKEAVSIFFGKSIAPKKLGMEEYFQSWIEECRSVKAERTIEAYQLALAHVKDFCKDKPWRLDFDHMTAAFYTAWLKYMVEVKKLTNNSLGGHIKNLKVFLKWAYRQGLHDRKDYEDFKILKYEVEVVYLNRKELSELAKLNLSASKYTHLDRVRDVFLFACETGLRFSDVFKLRPEDIREGTLHVRSKKGDQLLNIPLSPTAQQIITKYKGSIKALPVKGNRYLNRKLKELGELAKIEEAVTPFRKSGSTTEHITRPKCDVLTTHTARRTFVTLALEAGIRPEVVMKITGHRSYATMQRYLKLTNKVVREELAKVWEKQVPLMKAV